MRDIGDGADREVVAGLLAQSSREIEILSGRTYHPPRRVTSEFAPNGLPFVDVPDLVVATMKPVEGVWVVPDPVNSQVATVLQVATMAEPAPKAAPVAQALWTAGQLIAEASRAGRLSRDHVLQWLGAAFGSEPRREVMRRVMNPAVRFSVPILMASVDGWWIQISRRLIWVTNETEDEGRLWEPLLDPDSSGDDDALPLVAAEPVLVAAPMTGQPAPWAFNARIWPEGVRLRADRSWSRIAKAIHGSGLPTVTLDDASTPDEIACQLVLKAYWHGYVLGDDEALAAAVARAYPQQVEWIRRGTLAPNAASAAATLLEQLVQPGFDPAQGADDARSLSPWVLGHFPHPVW